MRTSPGRLVTFALAATALSCSPSPGLLETGTVRSSLLGREKVFTILRPTIPDGADPSAIPVIVVLHGMSDDPLSLDRFGLSEGLRRAMDRGEVPSAFLVMPDGERGFYLNWHDGEHPYEDYILQEVLPAADEMLGFVAPRERRHIMGVSMGGTGALQIGLRHPELFASVASLSGLILDQAEGRRFMRTSPLRFFADLEAVFGEGGDADYMAAYNPYDVAASRAPDLGQKVYLAAGTREDPDFLRTTRKFSAHLDRLGVEHELEVYEGGHGWAHWRPVIHRALRYVLGGDRGEVGGQSTSFFQSSSAFFSTAFWTPAMKTKSARSV